MKFKFFILTTFIFILSQTGMTQFYMGAKQEYGKNRVQYNGFGWKTHNYVPFKIYFSGASDELAIYTARTFNHYLLETEALFNRKFGEKIDIIVYESQAKYRQSNLGLSSEESSELAGSKTIVGSKVFVYYTGDHISYNKQIKKTILTLFLKKMFYGSQWKTQFSENLAAGIPEWLMDGLVDYLADDWDQNSESHLKDLVLTKRIHRFNDLTPIEKQFAGHAIWYFIAENYNKSTVFNIISLCRITGNFERALYSSTGLDYMSLNKKYISFFRKRYINDYNIQNEPLGNQIEIKTKKSAQIYSVKLSPDGKSMVYVENIMGRYKIKWVDLQSKKVEVIYKAEQKLERIQDYSYPVVEWHPSGDMIAFYTERKGEVLFGQYLTKSKDLELKPLKGFDKVLSFNYSPDGKDIVASTVVNGQTDLYIFPVRGGSKMQLTNDIYDDLNPRYIDQRHVVFSSNRPNDTIGPLDIETNYSSEDLDLFIYPIKNYKHTFIYLNQITNTADENEIEPMVSPDKHIQYLSERNGIMNRYESVKDSSIAFIDTTIHYKYQITAQPLSNSVTSIQSQHINEQNELVYVVYQNQQAKIFTQNLDTVSFVEGMYNATYLQSRIEKQKVKQSLILNQYRTDTSYINNVYYQKVIVNLGEEKKSDKESEKDSLKSNKDTFKAPRYFLYKRNFAKDYTTTVLDNNFLFPNYQVYSGPGTVYNNSGFNAMLKVGISDLFDDYKIVGASRIPLGLGRGGEQLLYVENLRNFLDHRLLFYRQKTVNTSNYTVLTTYDTRYRMSIPFTESLSLRTTANIRQDRTTYVPYSDATLAQNILYSHTAGLKTELVFDNSIPMELNIRRGSRMKIFAEYMRGIQDQTNTLNLGIDLRHYTRIKRNFIWVNRLASATSLGNKKLLYYLGGVDNWFSPTFNSDIDVDPNQNYGFQTIATPMRGFTQNIRNGNSFFLFTSEFRLPVFTYFSRYPVKIDMLRYFQLIAFTDIGSAWTGPHPLSPDNYFNTQIVSEYPITVTVQNLREPIVGSFGVGARTKIWGYFVKLDVGWGIENLEVQKPLAQLSLSLDI